MKLNDAHVSRRQFGAAIGRMRADAGPAASVPVADTSLPSLVSTEWLSEHLYDPDLVILDCTVHVKRTPEGVHADPALGYKDVAVYIASLQEWAADQENPLETGIRQISVLSWKKFWTFRV